MLHQIGVGALGPVFRTYEPTRDRLVAVKVFRLDVTPEQARALADELGRAADAGLFHPSIVEPVAAGLEGTVAYRAEEYVAAESLDVAMRHYAPATLDKALPFITQLASAIDFARDAGVGHGALHPRDIFVTPDEARATGFGVVDAMDRLGLRAPVRRPYSPPERIAGQPWNTTADVFSLAAIAFELLTGRRPSGLGDDMGSLSGAAPGDRSEAVREVLAKAMDENPAERYQTAQAFSAALAAAAGLAETPVAVAPRASTAAAPAVAPLESEIVPAPEEPIEPVSELPLTLATPSATTDGELALEEPTGSSDAAEPMSATGDDQPLDDMVGPPEVPSPLDSPREAARKAIAARKRQHKKKAEKAATLLPAETIASMPEIMPISLAPDPPIESEETIVQEPPPHEHAESLVSVDSADGAGLVEEETADEPVSSPATVFPALVSSDEEIDLVAANDEPIETRALEAVEFGRSERDLSDRIVAVDDFRAREPQSVKAERAWQRAPERTPVERPQFDRTDRAHTSNLGADLSLGGNATEQESPVASAMPSRQRVMMLPLALVAGLCLIVGYAVGYFVRGREAVEPQPTVVATAATTGTSAKPATGEGVVPPSGAPSAVAEHTPEPPKPSSTTPAATKAAPPAAAARSSNASVPRTGRVVVNSSPAKAGVTINGKWSGRTPLTIDDLKFGKYVVRIVEPGYEVEREQFTLSPKAASRTVDVTLKRKPGAKPPQASAAKASTPQAAAGSAAATTATGTIFVDSRPQGARVFIDNKEQGVTPVTLTGQTPGSRVVRLELPDHSPRSETVTLKPGATARVTGSLERIR